MSEDAPYRTAAIIAAAGAGVRVGAEKAFMDLRGRTLLQWSLDAFEAEPLVGAVVVVVPRGEVERAETLCRSRPYRKVIGVVQGGAERQDSVLAGLLALPPEWDAVLVHDVARPLFPAALVERLLQSLAGNAGAVPGVAVSDTLKEVAGGMVVRTLLRERTVAVQTPQAFVRAHLEEAHRRAKSEGFLGTDDAALLERLGLRVGVVDGALENLKITVPADLDLAEFFANRQREQDV